jgi:hypothetical protein
MTVVEFNPRISTFTSGVMPSSLFIHGCLGGLLFERAWHKKCSYLGFWI